MPHEHRDRRAAEVCFDLARDIGFHTRSLAHTGERAVAGRTAGLIELGESVTWEAHTWASAKGSPSRSPPSTAQPTSKTR